MCGKIFRLASLPWFLALVALMLRLAYLAYMAHSIPPQVLAAVPFQNEVGNVASSLAQGQGFCCLFRQPTGPTAWLSPVYPILVASIFKFSGIFTLRSFYVAVILNCVFSALATIPLFHAGKCIGGIKTAILSSCLWAVFPSGIILPFQWIWDTSLSALFAATLLWVTLNRKESSRLWDFTLYGLLWGMALLTNPALGAVLPFLLGWLLYQHRDNRALLLRLGTTALAVLFLACLPWTVRNFVQFHRFLPLRSNFPYEFWSGNNEIFNEHSREVNRITRFEQVHLYAQLGENEFLKEKMQNALHFVHAHPSLYVRLVGERVVATWLGTGSPWRDFWATDSDFARFILVWNLFALAGVIVGLVRLYLQNRPLFFPVAAFPLFFPFTFYIAHTTLRHRHPCDPILALLIAVAVSGAHAPARNSVEFSNPANQTAPFFFRSSQKAFRMLT
jgi:4-amino-4-deoxy-L-arabinose transferase-like glycosyltransferase